MDAEDKIQILWGAILLFGGPLTQYIAMSALPAFYGFFTWLILAGAGIFWSYKLSKESKRKPNKNITRVWKLLIGLGFIATFSIVAGIFNAHPSYILVAWLVFMGIGNIVEHIFENDKRGHVGTLFLMAAFFLIAIPDMLNYVFLLIAVACGIPMLIIGLTGKA